MKVIYIFLAILLTFASCHNPKKDVTKASEITVNSLQAEEKLANLYYKADDYAKSIACFTTLIKKDPDNGSYYLKRGYCFTQLHDKKNAIEDFKQAIKYHTQVAICYFNLGLAYSYDNDSLALIYFDKCLAINPQDSDAETQIFFCKKRLQQLQMSFPASK